MDLTNLSCFFFQGGDVAAEFGVLGSEVGRKEEGGKGRLRGCRACFSLLVYRRVEGLLLCRVLARLFIVA